MLELTTLGAVSSNIYNNAFVCRFLICHDFIYPARLLCSRAGDAETKYRMKNLVLPASNALCPYCAVDFSTTKKISEHVFSAKGYLEKKGKVPSMKIWACNPCNDKKSRYESVLNGLIHMPTNGFNEESEEFNRIYAIGGRGGARTSIGPAKASIRLNERPIISSKGYQIEIGRDIVEAVVDVTNYHAQALTMKATGRYADRVSPIWVTNPLADPDKVLQQQTALCHYFAGGPDYQTSVGGSIRSTVWVRGHLVCSRTNYGEQVLTTHCSVIR